MVDVEVLFGHDPEGADGGQRAAVLAVQLVDAITINDQLALLAARQVEVVHQAVARIVVVPVTLVVHARPPVVAIPLAVFARITPSSVRHRPLLAWVLLFGLSVKTPWQLLREVIQGSAEAPGRFAAAFRAWSCGNLGLRPLVRTSGGSVRDALTRIETAADQELLQTLYAPRSRRASWVAEERSKHHRLSPNSAPTFSQPSRHRTLTLSSRAKPCEPLSTQLEPTLVEP